MSSFKQWSILCSGCIFKQCLLTYSVECCGMPALSCKSRWKRKPSSASIQSQQRVLVVTGWYYGSGHWHGSTVATRGGWHCHCLALGLCLVCHCGHCHLPRRLTGRALPAQWVKQPSHRHTINATTPITMLVQSALSKLWVQVVLSQAKVAEFPTLNQQIIVI